MNYHLIIILVVLAVIVIVFVWTARKRLVNKTSSPQLVVTQPPVPRATTAKTTATASDVIITALVVVGLAVIGTVSVAFFRPEVISSLRSNRPTGSAMASKTEAPTGNWGEKKVIRLSSHPRTLPWPKTGGKDFDLKILIAPIEKNRNRQFWFESAGTPKLCREDTTGIPPIFYGQPIKLWSADGRPLDITVEWKTK